MNMQKRPFRFGVLMLGASSPALPALIKIILRLRGTFEYVKLADQPFV